MRAQIDKRRFGPWAVITGASSGIGKEFARQISASGVHVALVARREPLLRTVGAKCTQASGVQHRIIPLNLSEPDFLPVLVNATRDLDVGLVVSNAGTGNPGRFLDKSRQELMQLLRLNTATHLDIARHFAERLVRRGSGGLMFVGAMGADKGIPFMANGAGAKAYVRSLSLSLHEELKSSGIHVTVLPPASTETPVLEKFGFDTATMPMKPMTVDRCVYEGLRALSRNRRVIIPGRLNRIMNAVIPAAIARRLMARMLAKTGATAVVDKHQARENPKQPRENGSAQIATTTEPSNKAFVLEAFDALFNKRDYKAAERYWSPNYIQHSAHIPPGREGLFGLVKASPETMRYQNGAILAEGNMLMLHGRFSGLDLPANWIVVDIVRLENGVLAEHWDVIEDEATCETSVSGLPMFGTAFPSE